VGKFFPVLFVLLLFFSGSLPLTSRARGETPSPPMAEPPRTTEEQTAADVGLAEISGRIFLTGSEPHTYLVLEDSRGTVYRLLGPAVEQLARTAQGRTAVLRGGVVAQARGPGFPADFLISEFLALRLD
jgi:hypothetical protein